MTPDPLPAPWPADDLARVQACTDALAQSVKSLVEMRPAHRAETDPTVNLLMAGCHREGAQADGAICHVPGADTQTPR